MTRNTNETEFKLESADFESSSSNEAVYAVEQAEHSRDAALFLSRASLLISSRLDPQVALARAARLAIPYLADWCMIDLLDTNGFHRAQLAYRYAEDEMIASALRPNSIHLDATAVVLQALSSGSPILVDLQKHPALEECFAPIQAHGLMLTPLISQDQIIGVMTLILTKSGRTFKSGQRMIAQELGNRIAAIIEASKKVRENENAIKIRDEFISVAVHELRNPLTVLKLNVGLLKQMTNSNLNEPVSMETIHNITSKFSRSIDNLQHSIDRLFDMSVIRSGQLSLLRERMNLAELIAESLEQQLTEIGIAGCDLRLNLQNGVYASIDPFRIHQVMVNLVGNACKYAPGSSIDVSLTCDGKTARITVRDYGKGISETDQARIFDCFERGGAMESTSGLGLGLYIVRKIIQSHQGVIRLTSTVGQGAEFVLELPIMLSKSEGVRL